VVSCPLFSFYLSAFSLQPLAFPTVDPQLVPFSGWRQPPRNCPPSMVVQVSMDVIGPHGLVKVAVRALARSTVTTELLVWSLSWHGQLQAHRVVGRNPSHAVVDAHIEKHIKETPSEIGPGWVRLNGVMT
jgi:hypothetical protein